MRKLDCEDKEANKQEPTQVVKIEETHPKEITPTIYCHALIGIRTSQSLKIEGYIKNKR